MVMTSDAKHEVSQVWSLREFYRLNSGGELVTGTSADPREQGDLAAAGLAGILPLPRMHKWPLQGETVSRDPHTGSTAR